MHFINSTTKACSKISNLSDKYPGPQDAGTQDLAPRPSSYHNNLVPITTQLNPGPITAN